MTTPIGYFEGLYAANPDPWSFESRWYDDRKHALTAAAPTRRRYRSAFEPGCSTGRLTSRLADRCDHLLAVDAVESAVRTAAARVPGVTFRQARMPGEWPAGSFDLIVLSEIGYYFDDADLAALLDRAVTSLEPGGDLVAVHWRWLVAEHFRTGDDVHAALAANPGLHRQARHEEADFLLEVFTRIPPDPRSVAQRENLGVTRLAVVVPAHDEQALLPACLHSIAVAARIKLVSAGEGLLELGLAHRRAALDVALLGFVVELFLGAALRAGV